MRSHRTLYPLRCVILCLLVLAAVPVLAQEFEVTGIGLSSERGELNVVARPGDSLFFITSFDVPEGTEVRGVTQGEGSRDRVRLFFYRSIEPHADSTRGQATVLVDSAEVQIDHLSDPPTIRFASRLPTGLPGDIRSLQVEMGLYAVDEIEDVVFSDTRVSHIDDGGVPATGDPVDEFHATYLSVTHEGGSRPVVYEPAEGDTVPRTIHVLYEQPLDGLPGSLILRFVPAEPGPVTTAYLTDWTRGSLKELDVDALDVAASDGVDSVSGPTALNHLAHYDLQIVYRLQTGQLADTGGVADVFVDTRTESLVFLLPNQGTESDYPDVPVIYRVDEDAAWITIRFDVDSLSLVSDGLSPHIITLSSTLYEAGLHDFNLDGSNMGTQHPLVDGSNHGPLDSLRSQAVYYVTVEYADPSGNEPISRTNGNYVWPRDQLTLAPGIVHPINQSAENRTFWVEFNIPETPMLGTVRIQFDSILETPGSPHKIYLGNLGTAGPIAITLNALAFDHSNPPVTHTEGGPSLLHGHLYFIRVAYQDIHGNQEGANGVMVNFDDLTQPPIIMEPSDGDTLPLVDAYVMFEQPEDAVPGSVQLVLRQTSGPEVDPLSPHTLYLSDPSSATAANPKFVQFDPAYLAPGPGIDSVGNAGTLTSRAKYQLTVRYQDTLANEFGEDYVRDLIFPSGSQVTARGYYYPMEVSPGNSKLPALGLALKATGESALRGIKLAVDGEVQPEDIDASQVILWSSVDSVYSVNEDVPIDTLDVWYGSEMFFDSFAVELGETESHFIVTMAYTEVADPGRTIGIILNSGTAIDCGGDPVNCLNCPVGPRDIALPAIITSLFVEDPLEFGALKLIWDVASEFNNEGFNVWRRDPGQEQFLPVASFTEFPELYGRGTEPSDWRYQFIDRGLNPGSSYTYRLEVVSIGGQETQMTEIEATGTPRMPPNNFILRNAYPNPFNPETTIEYVVPYVAEVEITVFDLTGRRVRDLVRAQLAPAVYRTIWNGTDNRGMQVPSGVYFCQMQAGNVFNEARKMLLVR